MWAQMERVETLFGQLEHHWKLREYWTPKIHRRHITSTSISAFSSLSSLSAITLPVSASTCDIEQYQLI
jgi:hypothetical protein